MGLAARWVALEAHPQGPVRDRQQKIWYRERQDAWLVNRAQGFLRYLHVQVRSIGHLKWPVGVKVLEKVKGHPEDYRQVADDRDSGHPDGIHLQLILREQKQLIPPWPLVRGSFGW